MIYAVDKTHSLEMLPMLYLVHRFVNQIQEFTPDSKNYYFLNKTINKKIKL